MVTMFLPEASRGFTLPHRVSPSRAEQGGGEVPAIGVRAPLQVGVGDDDDIESVRAPPRPARLEQRRRRLAPTATEYRVPASRGEPRGAPRYPSARYSTSFRGGKPEGGTGRWLKDVTATRFAMELRSSVRTLENSRLSGRVMVRYRLIRTGAGGVLIFPRGHAALLR